VVSFRTSVAASALPPYETQPVAEPPASTSRYCQWYAPSASAPDEMDASRPLATSALLTVAASLNGVPRGCSSIWSCHESPSGSVVVALKITDAWLVAPPVGISVTASVRYWAAVAVAAGEDQRIVELPAAESVPLPWSFSYASPLRAPPLFVRASTRRAGAPWRSASRC
jgi:hypothetical protein